MRISVSKSMITLGRDERAMWTSRSVDARDLDATRARVREQARELASRTGRSVEVYAPKAAGGHVLDVVEPERAE